MQKSARYFLTGKEPRMKLKTKLVIVFLAVMILPMIFITVGGAHDRERRKRRGDAAVYDAGPLSQQHFLIYWIYRSVSVPLAKLQKAARNIKEGNLDFEIRQESRR